VKRKLLTRRQFLERLATLGGLGTAYCGMAKFGLLPLAQAYTGPPQFDQNIGSVAKYQIQSYDH
jgi:hypothetical protein